MLADPAAAEAVATGPDGIAAGMSAGKGYVDVSTVDAGTAQKISKVACVLTLQLMHVSVRLVIQSFAATAEMLSKHHHNCTSNLQQDAPQVLWLESYFKLGN